MLWLIVGFVLGLVVGWFFLPTPQFARNFMNRMAVKYPSLRGFMMDKPIEAPNNPRADADLSPTTRETTKTTPTERL